MADYILIGLGVIMLIAAGAFINQIVHDFFEGINK